MFKNLKSFFTSKEAPKEPATLSILKPTPVAPVTASAPAAPAKTSAPPTTPQPAKSAAAKQQTPEELCGVTAKMAKDEVRQRLALLYRRYNRATSSLDGQLRAEAEKMLDAIVAVRDKVFGPI